MQEKEIWRPFSWHCPNCGEIVRGKVILQSQGKEFFTWHGKDFFT